MHFDSQPHGPLFLIRRRSLVFNIWEHLGISKNTYDTVVHKCHHNFSNSVCIIVLALFCIFYLTPWLCTYSSFNFVFRFYILFLFRALLFYFYCSALFELSQLKYIDPIFLFLLKTLFWFFFDFLLNLTPAVFSYRRWVAYLYVLWIPLYISL